MRRIILLCAVCICFGAALIAGAKAFAPPDNSYSPLIDTLRRPLPGCPLPCWHDLVPGVTSFEQTETILDADPALTQVDIYPNGPIVAGFRDQPDTNRVEITFSSQHTVTTIGIVGKEPLGHILNLFGSPDYLSPYESCYSKALNLFYPIATIYLHASDVPRLGSQADLEVVFAADSSFPPADSFATWRGFTARYFSPLPLMHC